MEKIPGHLKGMAYKILKEKIAIYGAGGHGRLMAWTILECNAIEDRFELVCFIDDDPSMQSKMLNGIPVMNLNEAINEWEKLIVVSGIGKPTTRQQVMQNVASRGLNSATIVSPSAKLSPWVTIGVGTHVCTGTIISSNVELGRHVQINLDCTIGHDAVIGDFVTISPGVHLAGNVAIGDRAFLGVGVVVINGTEENPLVIGDDAIVGAGACVTQSVPAGTTVVGVPAKPISRMPGKK